MLFNIRAFAVLVVAIALVVATATHSLPLGTVVSNGAVFTPFCQPQPYNYANPQRPILFEEQNLVLCVTPTTIQGIDMTTYAA